MHGKRLILEPLRSGLAGGALSGVISWLLNYYLLPVPQTQLDNAMGHGFSGLFSGFFSGFVAVLVFMLLHRRSSARRAKQGGEGAA